MVRLTLSLLGPFQALVDGEPATGFSTAKVRALLAYLAMESDRPHRREALTGLLWPDRPERSARQNLSQALYNLRNDPRRDSAEPPFLAHHLADAPVQPGVRFRPRRGHVLRAAGTRRGPAHGAPTRKCASSRWSPCRSTAAPSWRAFPCPTARRSTSGSPCSASIGSARCWRRYSNWQSCMRDTGSMPRPKIVAAARWPWSPRTSAAHRQMMRALALGGERNAALAQYDACARLLDAELGVVPAPETTALYERIRHGELVAPVHIGPIP